MSVSADESFEIVSRMRELRSTGQRDIVQLHVQAERVTDWREHVRAQPVLTAAVSTALGFLVVRGLVGNGAAKRVESTSSPLAASTNRPSTGLLSIVGGIVMSVGRQWVTEYLKKQLGVNAHAANQSTHADQRSNANC